MCWVGLWLEPMTSSGFGVFCRNDSGGTAVALEMCDSGLRSHVSGRSAGGDKAQSTMRHRGLETPVPQEPPETASQETLAAAQLYGFHSLELVACRTLRESVLIAQTHQIPSNLPWRPWDR